MEEEDRLVFKTCRNYKSGIYIFNSIKKEDFIVVLICVIIALVIIVIAFREPSTVIKGSFIAMMIAGIPIFLVLPVIGFHAMYYRIAYLLKYAFSNRIWMWEGRKDNIEEILIDEN